MGGVYSFIAFLSHGALVIEGRVVRGVESVGGRGVSDEGK